MSTTLPVIPGTDLVLQVLRQMAWFRHELAVVENSGLGREELASIRRAILKSLAELETAYAAID